MHFQCRNHHIVMMLEILIKYTEHYRALKQPKEATVCKWSIHAPVCINTGRAIEVKGGSGWGPCKKGCNSMGSSRGEGRCYSPLPRFKFTPAILHTFLTKTTHSWVTIPFLLSTFKWDAILKILKGEWEKRCTEKLLICWQILLVATWV